VIGRLGKGTRPHACAPDGRTGRPIEVDLATIDAHKAGSHPAWQPEEKVLVSTCPTASGGQPVRVTEEVRR
jgi:hypothetical protein